MNGPCPILIFYCRLQIFNPESFLTFYRTLGYTPLDTKAATQLVPNQFDPRTSGPLHPVPNYWSLWTKGPPPFPFPLDKRSPKNSVPMNDGIISSDEAKKSCRVSMEQTDLIKMTPDATKAVEAELLQHLKTRIRKYCLQ